MADFTTDLLATKTLIGLNDTLVSVSAPNHIIKDINFDAEGIFMREIVVTTSYEIQDGGFWNP